MLDPTAAVYFRLAGGASADAELTARLAAGVDWAALRALGRRDGTTSALWRRLRAAGAGLPDAERDAFTREAQVLDFHRLRLERRLGEALELLGGAGLRPLLLKGAALSVTAYGRPVDRPMADADLLVAPSEAPEAVRVLVAAGWRPEREGGDDRRYAGHHHLPPLREPGPGRAVLEVHRELLPTGHPFRWDAAAVWARARTVERQGRPVLVPSAEDLLLHVCLHFAWAHELRWGAWRAIADVAALVAPAGAASADGGVPWERAFALAAAAGAETAVHWTLRLAEALGGVRVPTGAGRRGARAGRPVAEGWLLRLLAQELVPGGARIPSVAAARWLWARAIRPERCGHGAVRPWTVGAAATPPAGGAPASGRHRVAAWRRYWRRLAGRGGS